MNNVNILQNSLIEGLSALPGVHYCNTFPRRLDQVTLPAIFVDLVELAPDVDPGTSELALITHWEARILVSENQPDAHSLLHTLVLAAWHWLFNHSWPEIHIGRVRFKQAAPDYFSPERQGHLLWLLEWTQPIRVGESVWDGQGVVPETIEVNWNL